MLSKTQQYIYQLTKIICSSLISYQSRGYIPPNSNSLLVCYETSDDSLRYEGVVRRCVDVMILVKL